MSTQPGMVDTDVVLVRTMRADDLEAVVSIDAAASGRRRPKYYQLMLERALKQTALQASLVAELDEHVVGFVIVSVYYGEYGVMEPTASLEAIGVASGYRRQHVGKALMRQLRLNLGALRVTSLRTEVSWNNFELLAFFNRQGFSLSDRLCLQASFDPTAIEE